ncbi:CvpA family protein [Gilvimarinus polysaccharolyticus]|uniref:CvpA family protein n=1 Tax=Gilvimarinus polysaccharolyticus TaxID=863921 RepID=UPI00067390D1|nr:CvpA family protein [Gilvimarinus polysaccharolyticus]
MNWADWTIAGILAVSCLISIKRGFVKEALSLVVWVAAFVIASIFDDRLAVLMTDLIPTPSLRAMSAFAILFAATLIIGAMVNYLIGELVRMTGLSGTDRLFGMVFGLVRGALVVLAIVILLPSLVPVNEDAWWQESVLIPRFLVFETWARTTTDQALEWITSFF